MHFHPRQDRAAEEDRAIVLEEVKNQMQEAFQKDWDNVVTLEPLLYGDFLDLKNPCYQELSDLAELEERVSARTARRRDCNVASISFA